MTRGLPGSAGQILTAESSRCVTKDPWNWWRDQMPITQKWAYLDHGAVGPLSGPAADAVAGFAQQAALEGDTVWPTWVAASEHLRGSIAQTIGAEKSEICLVPNTTTGINLVAEGWAWEKGAFYIPTNYPDKRRLYE